MANPGLFFPSKSDPLHWAAWIGDYKLVKAYINGWRKPRKNKLRNASKLRSVQVSNGISGSDKKKKKEKYPKLSVIPRDSLDENENTPLHYAVMKGFVKVVSVLLEGSETSYREIRGIWGSTPLLLAFDFETRALRVKPELLDLLLKDCSDEYCKISDDDGRCPLECAIATKDVQTLKLMMNTGVKCPNHHIFSVLEAREVDMDMVKLVLPLTEEGNQYIRFINGKSLLNTAARYGCGDLVKLLLKNAPKSYRKVSSGNGHSALMLAAQSGSVEVMKLLLKDMPQSYKELTANDGKTALHLLAESYAVRYGDGGELYETLLDGSLPGFREMVDCSGQTALHCAVALSNSAIPNGVKALLKNSAPKFREMTDNKGLTALHIAASRQSVAIVELLLEGVEDEVKYMNMENKDGYGYTALEYVSSSQTQMVHALLDKEYGYYLEKNAVQIIFAMTNAPSEDESNELWGLDSVIRETLKWGLEEEKVHNFADNGSSTQYSRLLRF